MIIEPFCLEGLLLVKPAVFSDGRGSFLESYQEARYRKAGLETRFIQDNLAHSRKRVLRGLHYQEHPPQAKLVSAAWGKIWDVAVDLRPHSPTFGAWAAVELNDENRYQLFIPAGFAHGYCVLSEAACVLYKVDAPYNALTEKVIRWDDPALAIPWPIDTPVLSEKDRQGAPLGAVR